MKTISFYSYKGGVGRTLLVAQVARYLAGLGRKVVVVDFDFDAPGIPGIFGLNAFDDVSRGLLDLVLEFHSADHSSAQFKHQLSQCLISPAFNVEHLRKGSQGWLKILPSGNAGSEKYWDTISSASWVNLLSAQHAPNPMVRFVNHLLKPALEAIGVDYLLVDSRAGITHYGGISKRIADREVIIFCPNDEAQHALQYLAEGLKKLQIHRAKENKDRSNLHLPVADDPELDFTLVISRVPAELPETQTVLRTWHSWLRKKFGRIPGYNGILNLHSDLHTHLDQQRRFPRQDTPADVVQFQEDVIRILANLCPEEVPDAARGKSLEKQADALWQVAFGRPFEITYVNRIFGLLDDRGEILNLDDGQRNVAFKVDTFLRFLNIFYDGFEEDFANQLESQGMRLSKYKKRIEVQRRVARTLTRAGHQCGSAFGRVLARQLDACNEFESDQAKILEWCKFDSRAGFGRLEFRPPDNLCIKNLFLWNPKWTGRRDFSSFFTGYAESVLNQILKNPISLKQVGRPSRKMRYKIQS